jgi:hypothetical protein
LWSSAGLLRCTRAIVAAIQAWREEAATVNRPPRDGVGLLGQASAELMIAGGRMLIVAAPMPQSQRGFAPMGLASGCACANADVNATSRAMRRARVAP